MRPGVLNRRVQVWRDQGATQDRYNAPVEDWQVLASRWARIDARRGTEHFRDESERERQPVIITVRYDEVTSTITPADRVRYGEIEYDIQSSEDRYAEHRYIDLACLRRAPEARRTP